MKNIAIRIISVAVLAAMIITTFSSCKNPFKSEQAIPDEVFVKTNLDDPTYTFTYGELRDAIPLDKLADLFENYDKKDSDTEITLSYDEIASRFSADVMKDDGKAIANIWALATPEELAATTANKDKVVDYFNTLINNTKQEKPITKYDESFWTDDSKDTLKFTRGGTEVDNKTDDYKALRSAAILFSDYVTDGAKDKLLGHIKDADGNEKNITEKGEDLTNIMYLLGSDKASLLTSDDIESAISSVKSETTTVNKVKYITGYTRTITITLKQNEDSVLKAFSMHDKAPILKEMEKANGYFTMNDYEVTPGKCTIKVVIDATTDEITSVTYLNNMTVKTALTGVNDFASLGNVGVQFNCTDKMYYQFGWHTTEE